MREYNRDKELSEKYSPEFLESRYFFFLYLSLRLRLATRETTSSYMRMGETWSRAGSFINNYVNNCPFGSLMRPLIDTFVTRRNYSNDVNVIKLQTGAVFESERVCTYFPERSALRQITELLY